MKKTTRIRLFLVAVTLACCGAYGGGYYFSTQQSEKRLQQELALENQKLQEESQANEESAASSTAAVPYEFVLCEEDGYITVYCADRETIYESTDIKVKTLSQELQKEIKTGKPIYSEQELYNFLESHSS